MSGSSQDPVVSAPGQGTVSDLARPEGWGIQPAPWGGVQGGWVGSGHRGGDQWPPLTRDVPKLVPVWTVHRVGQS